MKTFLLIGGAAAMLAFSACSKDGYTEITRTLSGSALNIITNEDDGSVIVTPGNYIFNITMRDNDQSGYITSPDLIANNTALGFTTDEQAYQSTGYDVYFKDVKATAGATGMQILNSQILGISYFDETYNPFGFYVDTTEIGPLTFSINSNNTMETVARYYIGSSYRVNTFPANSFFLGTTTTSYTMAGQTQNFSTETITYRFIIEKVDNTNDYKATMVMYNAKFTDNEREPLKVAIIAAGLDVDFSSSGVAISGQDIIPDVYEAGATTPYENFKFNKIEFKTTDDFYTKGVLDFQVAGIYSGHFEGQYLFSKFIK